MIQPPPAPYAGNENALLALSVGSIAGRRPRERHAAMTLMPILRATPDLEAARAALAALEDEHARDAATSLLDRVLAAHAAPPAPWPWH